MNSEQTGAAWPPGSRAPAVVFPVHSFCTRTIKEKDAVVFLKHVGAGALASSSDCTQLLVFAPVSLTPV